MKQKIYKTANEFLSDVCKNIQEEKDIYIYHFSLDGENTFMQDENGDYYCDICIDLDGLARELSMCQAKQPDMIVMVEYIYSAEQEVFDKRIFIMKSC